MLDAMRRGAQSWVAKILFGLLVFSFAIWGVADVFRGFGQGSLATVGGTEIDAGQFQQAFQNEINAISRQAGQRLTAEQARNLGLDQRVLQRLVGSAAIETHARQLNLGLSNATLAEGIRKDPNLKDIDGKFNRALFDGFLRQVGLTEQGFLAIRRQEELRDQLTGSLVAATATPRALVDLTHAHRQETRVIEHFTIDAGTAVKVGEPDEARIKETYEQNKAQFMTPEYRKLAVLVLGLEAIKKRHAVPDDELRKSFEAEKDQYGAPEKRRLQQISFKDKAAAEAARARITAGQSFADAAKQAGAKESDIELGLVTKAQMLDAKIADAAFKLKKDEVSAPIEGRFTTVLVRVAEIQPGKEPAFDEVKERIRDRMAGERARADIQKIHDDVDDNRGAGKTLKDIADALKLEFFEVAAADKTNKAPDGKRALDIVNGDVVISGAFEGRTGIDSEAIELPDGGYAWADVLATTPAAQKPFEAVKDDAKAVFMDAERRRTLASLAAKLVERANAGEAMATLAGEVGGKAETTLAVTRSTLPQGLTRPAVTQAFALKKGGAGSSDTADGKSRIVFRVAAINAAPPPTKEQAELIEKELASQLQNDHVTEYVLALQERLGVSVNQSVLRRATGITGDQQ